MEDDEILACVAESSGLRPDGGTVTPLTGKQGLIVCRVTLHGAPPFIFKAVRESGRAELRLASRLAEIAPYAVPEVIAAREDERRGVYWLILRDVGERRLSGAACLEQYARVAATLARLQIDTLADVEALKRLGTRSIDAAGWEEIALTLIAAMDDGSAIGIAHRDEMVECLWNAGEMAVYASTIPLAIVHGDLHADNIAIDETDSPRLIDWGSAYIGFAFLGLSELLWPLERRGPRTNDLGHVRKAYLDCWTPILGKPGRLAPAIAACEALTKMSLVQEARRHPDRFGDYGAATMAHHFLEACRHWERSRC